MFLFKSELNIYLRIVETPTALLRRRRVAILILGSVLLGAVLGRFFKVLVLVLACAFVLAVVLVRSADGEHGLLRPLLEFAVLITSLQIGYVSGVRFWRNAGQPWPRPRRFGVARAAGRWSNAADRSLRLVRRAPEAGRRRGQEASQRQGGPASRQTGTLPGCPRPGG